MSRHRLLFLSSSLLAISLTFGCNRSTQVPTTADSSSSEQPKFEADATGGEALVGTWTMRQVFDDDATQRAAEQFETKEERDAFVQDIESWEADTLFMTFGPNGDWTSQGPGPDENDSGKWRVTESSPESLQIDLFFAQDEAIDSLRFVQENENQFKATPSAELISSIGIDFHWVFERAE